MPREAMVRFVFGMGCANSVSLQSSSNQASRMRIVTGGNLPPPYEVANSAQKCPPPTRCVQSKCASCNIVAFLPTRFGLRLSLMKERQMTCRISTPSKPTVHEQPETIHQ